MHPVRSRRQQKIMRVMLSRCEGSTPGTGSVLIGIRMDLSVPMHDQRIRSAIVDGSIEPIAFIGKNGRYALCTCDPKNPALGSKLT